MFYLLILAICGLNVFDWWRIRLAFLRHSPVFSACLLLFMLALILSPAWMRCIFPHGTTPRLLGQAAWIWLAWSFWLFCALCLVLLWNFAGDMICIFHGGSLLPQASPLLGVCISFGAVVFLSIWGHFEAGAIRLREVTVHTDKLPAGVPEYNIALLSDLHIGPAASEARLRRAIGLINQSGADLILSAGDLIDGATQREREMARELQELKCASGVKLAVFGNHDMYSGEAFSRECHELAGFQLLCDQEAVNLPSWLAVFGERDPVRAEHPGEKIESKTPEFSPDKFNILLKHRPKPAAAPMDLQLSGHSHGGQIFPFNFLVRLQYAFSEGKLHDLPGGGKLYVSPGTGVWGPPFRVLARPEVTVIKLKRNSSEQGENAIK